MNTYVIYLDWEDEESHEMCTVTVKADYFEMSKDDQYIIFKTGTQTTGLFKISDVVGVSKE